MKGLKEQLNGIEKISLKLTTLMDEKKQSYKFYFFIGTEAELIKLLPVLLEIEKKKISYKIISSGQNNILSSPLLKLLKKKKLDFILHRGSIKQTAPSLFFWFLKTLPKSLIKLRSEFNYINRRKTVFVIHGDTISTVMGALIGNYFGLTVAHIEAGLRSFNFLHPFPEELDRVIASHFTRIHFCPNHWAVENLKKKKGVKINTLQNTLYDSLHYVMHFKFDSETLKKLKEQKFFIFIMHRQENLFNVKLVKSLVAEITATSEKMKCLFVMHKPTILALEKMGMMQKLRNNKNIILTPRLNYIEFMKILDKSEFIITDGGSNQEETFYLGKACLILRKHTERIEGLNENVVLSKNSNKTIRKFIENYKKYQKKKIVSKESPSKIITNYLMNMS